MKTKSFGGMMDTKRHEELVEEMALSPSAAAQSRLYASWRRSMVNYGLRPGANTAPTRLTQAELAEELERNDRLIQLAQTSLDQLFRLVGNSGCCVLITSADGVVLDQRTTDADARTFDGWGLWQGGVWSEEIEGTNGMGTCLTERRAIIIHRHQHFYTRNTIMSCMDAPIFGADGQLIAALDVSSARADQTEAYSKLIANAVVQTAQRIETENFRAAFPNARIIVGPTQDSSSPVLLAVDEDDLVIGATRGARIAFGLNDDILASPRPASDVLGIGNGSQGLESAERAELRRALARAGGNVSKAARGLGISRATFYRRMKRVGLDG